MAQLEISIIGVICELFAFLSVSCIVLFLYVVYNTGRLKKFPSFLLLFSYAIVDLGNVCFSILVFSLIIAPTVCENFPPQVFAKMDQFIYVNFSSNKLLHLLVIALDRFFAVFAPNMYRIYITRRTVLIELMALWFLGFAAYILAVAELYCCTANLMNCTTFEFAPLDANVVQQPNVYFSAFITVGFATFVVVVISYSAIIGKLARARCHPQVEPTSNLGSNNQRREIRLAVQFATISVLFFGALAVTAVRSAVVEIQVLFNVLVLLVMSIDTPLLCICNPGLRSDILKVLKCSSSSSNTTGKHLLLLL